MGARSGRLFYQEMSFAVIPELKNFRNVSDFPYLFGNLRVSPHPCAYGAYRVLAA
jgi:hypothetical protein